MAHARCVLDNKGYRHTLRMCNTAFSRQQWFPEGAPVLHLHYIARLVIITIIVFII